MAARNHLIRQFLKEVPAVVPVLFSERLQALVRSTEARQRRVIHLEFSRRALPGGLAWAER